VVDKQTQGACGTSLIVISDPEDWLTSVITQSRAEQPIYRFKGWRAHLAYIFRRQRKPMRFGPRNREQIDPTQRPGSGWQPDGGAFE